MLPTRSSPFHDLCAMMLAVSPPQYLPDSTIQEKWERDILPTNSLTLALSPGARKNSSKITNARIPPVFKYRDR